MNEQFKQRAHDKLEILRVMSPAQVTHDAMLRSLRDLLAHWAAAPDWYILRRGQGRR